MTDEEIRAKALEHAIASVYFTQSNASNNYNPGDKSMKEILHRADVFSAYIKNSTEIPLALS